MARLSSRFQSRTEFLLINKVHESSPFFSIGGSLEFRAKFADPWFNPYMVDIEFCAKFSTAFRALRNGWRIALSESRVHPCRNVIFGCEKYRFIFSRGNSRLAPFYYARLLSQILSHFSRIPYCLKTIYRSPRNHDAITRCYCRVCSSSVCMDHLIVWFARKLEKLLKWFLSSGFSSISRCVW